MSYKEITKASTKTNQIGNFTSLSVGSGSTIFKAANGWLWGGGSNAANSDFRVNLSTGGLYANNATISGLITATGGSITGDLSVTGKLIFKSGSTEKGRVYASSSGIYITIDGKGLQVDSNGNVFVPNADLTVYNDIESTHGTITCLGGITSTGGGLTVRNDIVSTTGYLSVANYIETQTHISAQNDIRTYKGKVIANADVISENNDIWAKNGSVHCKFDMYSEYGSIWAKDKISVIDNSYWCRGSEGITNSGYGFINGIKIDDGKLKARFAEIKVKGGIVYGFREDSYYTVGNIN